MRRLGILGVLLLSLIGFIPAAWACAVMAQRTDCCPDHKPCSTAHCDTGSVAVSVSLGSAACCSAQQVPTRAFVSVNVTKEDAHSAASYPDQWAGIPAGCTLAARTLRMRAPINFDSLSRTHQQQLYLQTGRLRL